MTKLKKCRITNCPSYTDSKCSNEQINCEHIDCKLKQMVLKPKQRMEYIKNKLSSCLGYSEKEKRIRYEELSWILKEYCNMLNIEVEEDGNWCLVKESLEKEQTR